MFRTLITIVALSATLTACKKEEDNKFTAAEAGDALAETAAASTAMALTSESIEVATDFTLGEGVEKAWENLRAFYESQIPCADVSLADGVVTVDYGATGDCIWRGKVYKGKHLVGITKAEAGEIEVGHEWVAFTDGRALVDGTATVTWSLADKTRHVTHDVDWTVGDRSGNDDADVTQTALGGGGLQVTGERMWTGAKGTWLLEAHAVTAYASDPVPESGEYVLTNPEGRTLTMSFARLDADRIEVTLTANKSFVFVVRKAGQIAES